MFARIVLGLGFVSLLGAQTGGDLKVVVLDPSEAAVPNARVTVRSAATAGDRAANTPDDGVVRFTRLAIGPYRIRVEAPGFGEYETHADVTSGAVTTVPVRLAVQAVQAEISVSEAATHVNTVDSQIQFSRGEAEITNLPLIGGPLTLALTLPGVTPNRKTNGFSGQGYFSVNGGRGRANNISLDNATATDVTVSGESGLGTVPLEGLAEFTVITNNFNAEYGRNSNSQVQLLTRSGTNSFHGTVFEHLRNGKLNAREFFDVTGESPVLRENDWGAVAGGPVRRDRVFVFGTYEQIKVRGEGGARQAVVPRTEKITSDIDPTAAELLRRFQVPVTPSGTLVTTSPEKEDSLALSGRMDANLTQKDYLYLRAGTQKVEERSPAFTFIGSDLPTSGAGSVFRDTNATLSETHVFTPRAVNQFMASFTRADPAFTPLYDFGGPNISFRDGTSAMGVSSAFPQTRVQNTFQYLDTFTYARGRHQLKFGGEADRIQANDLFDNATRGLFQFLTLDDFLHGVPFAWQQRFGKSYRGYRVWDHALFAQDDFRVAPSVTLNIGLRLELAGGPNEVNGLLSNLNTGKQESLGAAGPGPLGGFDLGGAAFHRNWNWGPRAGFAWNPRGSQFAVRGGYGIAYDFIFLNPIVNMRFQPPLMYTLSLASTQFTGGNTFAALVAGTADIQRLGQSLPGSYGTSPNFGAVAAVDQNLKNPQVQQWNLTVERQLGAGFIARASYVGNKGTYLLRTRPINTIAPGAFTPPATLEEEQRLFQQGEFTRVNTGLANGRLRIDPRFTAVQLTESSANSIYHAAQFYLARRFTGGLGLSVAYTWSKSIDDVSDPVAHLIADYAVQQNPLNNHNNRAVSAYDVPHRLAVTHVLEPRFAQRIGNPVLRYLLDGWQLHGLWQIQSGYPVTVVSGARLGLADPTLVGGLGAVRPNVVGPVNLKFEPNPGLGAANPNKAAGSGLAPPLVGNFGNLGRNPFRMNGLWQTDLTLGRAIAIRESLRTEIQARIFNVFNHTTFNRPGAQLATAQTFGYYGSTESDPRSVTLLLRVSW
jgi:hypothetical protein